MYVFTQLDGQQEWLSFTCPSLSLLVGYRGLYDKNNLVGRSIATWPIQLERRRVAGEYVMPYVSHVFYCFASAHPP